MNGLMTEREWRKQFLRKQKRPEWYGAQCVIKQESTHPLYTDRAFHLFLLLLAILIAILLPIFVPRQQPINALLVVSPDSTESFYPRQVSSIRYEPYTAKPLKMHISTVSELSASKLFLVDTDHPFPGDLPPQNTFSIASYGHGMIPVAGLQIQSGKETIEALKNLFYALREKGVHNLQVCAGTVSKAQQRKQLLLALRNCMKTACVTKALIEVLSWMEWPGTGEMLGEYTVEMRFHPQSAETTGSAESTRAEQILFQTAWRYGFICTKRYNADGTVYRFRYVGIAHATAMTFLNLDLETYLHFLHQKGSLTIWEHDEPKYLIVSKPMNGSRVQFDLPEETEWEAGMDNLGYAVAVCTL